MAAACKKNASAFKIGAAETVTCAWRIFMARLAESLHVGWDRRARGDAWEIPESVFLWMPTAKRDGAALIVKCARRMCMEQRAA